MVISLRREDLLKMLKKMRQLLEGNMSERVESLMQNSIFSAKQINNLINDLLDLAKLEKGNFSFNNEFFNLIETIK